MQWSATILAAYVLGSITGGLLIGKVFYGVDVREFGSRKTGATNVLRTLGKKAALAAFLVDVAKGVAAVAFAKWLLPGEAWAHVLAAGAAMIGHNWPVFAGFRGGRGVLVGASAVGVLHFPVLLGVCIAGLPVIWRTRYVSAGSIIGAAAAPLLFVLFYLRGDVPLPYLIFGAVAGAVVIISHKDNIGRLMAGTESRLGQRVSTDGRPSRHVAPVSFGATFLTKLRLVLKRR